jgi:hypothetical protein
MDPLSGVLSLLKPQNTMFGGFDVGGDWSLQFPEERSRRKGSGTESSEKGVRNRKLRRSVRSRMLCPLQYGRLS